MRAGILDETDGEDLEAHIHRDPHLTDRQKQTLVDVYRSFRGEDPPSGAPEGER